MIIGKYPSLRLRRNRKESWSRKLIQENTLSPNDFILPIFLIEGSNKRQPISSMPGVYRYTINIYINDNVFNEYYNFLDLYLKLKLFIF